MRSYLYGIVESNALKDFGAIGFETADFGRGKVEALPSRNIAAVIGPAPEEDFGLLSKERLVKTLLTHQETLEMIMKSQFILPCKFGTVLRDQEEVRAVLLQNERRLEEWISKMKDCFETDVVVTWDSREVLKGMAEGDPEIESRIKAIQTFSPEREKDEKIALGMSLAAKLKDYANQWADEILFSLKKVSQESALHDTMNDDMVLNASFLLKNGQEDSFFKTVEHLDRICGGKFNFRCIGPLPLYSFSMILVKEFEEREIRRAKEVLGLEGDQNLETVKHAYKEKSRKCHPDIHPELDDQEFQKIHEAYDLLLDYCQGGRQPWKVDLFQINGKG
ncbi:MAG: GvpL/GvpF family gas vesicle protein [Chlamydiae bacterium]|nr:GvpL/GvpF family gas vesicle protein [Chlamydiota bacterium]MBI3266493.1 GvpL/GvpF family gas vesicle protein [Chlamydiota bacterium]